MHLLRSNGLNNLCSAYVFASIFLTMKKYNLFKVLTILLMFSLFQMPVNAQTKSSLYPDSRLDIRYHSEWTKKHYPERIAAFMAKPLPPGAIVFIGNSITEGGGDWNARFGIKNIWNRGISGDVTDGVLARLGEIIHSKPKAIFLLIGINDISNLYYEKQIPSTDYIAANILKITVEIHQKSPATKIYLQTVLPTNRVFTKQEVDAVNAVLRAKNAKGAFILIDLYAAFADEKGLLKKEFTNDGIHLTAAGYDRWVAVVKPYMSSL